MNKAFRGRLLPGVAAREVRSVRNSAILVLSACVSHRAAELNLRKTEAITQRIGGFRQTLEFFPALRVQEVKLFAAVGERRERHADESDLAPTIPVAIE